MGWVGREVWKVEVGGTDLRSSSIGLGGCGCEVDKSWSWLGL